jgi:ABC-type spermidine/putrescine transport system permease subunit I
VPDEADAVALTRPRRRRARRVERESGVWYPKWYWPSFAAPAILWLSIFFVLPIYTVVSLAFGTSDPIFRTPLPVYQPWYWSTDAMEQVLGRFFGEAAFWQPVLFRTLFFVAAASLICLVVGYSVAYYVARYGGRRKALYLVLLISPFWISYLMRIFAWQSLLQPDGYVNDFIGILGVAPVTWLDGKPITVILSLVYGYIPFMILPIYGQLDRINESLLEAGRDLGASPIRTFLRVTLPMSKQAILAGMVIVSLPMFGDYFTNDLMGTTQTRMYGNLVDAAIVQQGQGPRAGALVLLLILFLMIPMMYYLRATKRAAEAR